MSPLSRAERSVFMSDDFVKLGDFGLSKDMGNSAFTDTYVGVSWAGPADSARVP